MRAEINQNPEEDNNGLDATKDVGILQKWDDLQAKIDESILYPQGGSYRYYQFHDGKMNAIKIILQLGDFIHRWELVPSEIFLKINTFKQKNVTCMLQFHTQILSEISVGSYWWGRLVIPQLGFLTTSQQLGHFHRSIHALSEEDKKLMLYDIMNSSFESYKQKMIDEEISKTLQRFLSFNPKDLERLSSNMESQQMLQEFNGLINTIYKMIDYFQNHGILDVRKGCLELLFVYSSLDFLDRYYQPIMNSVKNEMDQPEVFARQLHIMGLFVKGYKRDTLAFNLDLEKEEMAELFQILKNYKSEDNPLRQWIFHSTKKNTHTTPKEVESLTKKTPPESDLRFKYVNCRLPYFVLF